MYSYSGPAPRGNVWPLLQPFTYTYLPGPLLLPSIQAHSFCSWGPTQGAGDWTAPREYHYFHGPGASLGATPLCWAFPQAYAAILHPPSPAHGYSIPSLQMPAAAGAAAEVAESRAQWPEGGSLQAELRWGLVERALGPRLEMPDFVRRELRRVYGTYPRTNVRVTFRGGEFLLQGTPRVNEPEYHVQRRLLRPRASSSSGDPNPTEEAATERSSKKRKGLG